MIGIARALFKSNVKSGSGVAPFDPDAQTFITAANITNPTQQSAVNQLVLDFKSIGVWTKEKAVYPVLGGSASSHAVNLKQPGTFNLSFATGWTHSSNGMLPNGATYANTTINPSVNLIQNSNNFTIYSRTPQANSGLDVGVDTPTFRMFGYVNYTNLIGGRNNRNSNETESYTTNTNGSGFFQFNRNSLTNESLIKNSLIFNNNKTANGLPNGPAYLGAAYGPTVSYSIRQLAFSSFGDGLTDTEAVNKTVAVQKYQRALGRAVDMEIQVGTGATRSYYTPFSTLDNYSISGNIYLQSEVIGAAIPMLGIEMYFSGFTLPYTMTNQEIYLAHVTQSQFDSAPAVDFSDLTLSDLTLVKASFTFTAANNAWVRMNFDTPFQYNGTSNILVIWKNNRGTWSSGGGGSDTHTSTSRSMYKVGSTGQPTGNGTLTNSRSNIKFIW